MNEQDWSELTYGFSKGNCVLMLGPDVAREQVGAEEKTLEGLLANELAEDLRDKELLDPNSLLQVAQQYEREHSLVKLQLSAQQFFQRRENQTSDVHSDLAALPFSLIISSSHDKFLEAAYQQSAPEKEPIVDWYNSYEKQASVRPSFSLGSPDRPLLYYLYGAIEEPDSLVLSEGNLLDFLIAVVGSEPKLPSALVNALTEPNKTFLFVGFGFRQWHLRILLHLLSAGKRQTSSFALEQLDAAQSRQVALYYGNTHKIKFEDVDPREFTRELRKRLEQQGLQSSRASGRVTQPDPTAPGVFICHASEDAETAAALTEALTASGLRPWLDKDDIRGGDDWDRLIEKTIDKEVEYFVVLQSQALARKVEGYVNKEILRALERQKRFQGDISFIIPITIGESPQLEDLSGRQTIKLRDADDVGALVSTIKRDQQKRRRQ